MMKRGLLLLSALLMSLAVMAQTGVETGTPFGHGNDSIDCRKNITFYKTYVKSDNFPDAYVFWKRVYDNCPGATKDTYIIGADLLKWQIENAETPEARKEWVGKLMEMYDTRIKYFGDDPDNGTDYILGNKVSDYMNLMGNESDYDLVYSWLEPIVKEMGAETDGLALSLFTYASMAKMVIDPTFKEQYVNDQIMVDGFYDQKIASAKAAGNTAATEAFEGYKAAGQTLFAQSGAASCDVMEEVYGPQIEDKKQDKEFLAQTVALLRSVGCTESSVYFAASEYLYNLEPSTQAALGIANKAFKDKNYARAKEYYEDAIKMSNDNSEKGEINYMLALMSYQQGSYGAARNYANQAMSLKSGFGAPMILIAQMYAASAKNIYPDDPVKMRIVYCLVVDKAERARAMDPSVANEANRIIGSYRQHFPAKEDVFMHPDLEEGASFTVGGWIGETTTIRTSN